jgi:hypothetical protein
MQLMHCQRAHLVGAGNFDVMGHTVSHFLQPQHVWVFLRMVTGRKADKSPSRAPSTHK